MSLAGRPTKYDALALKTAQSYVRKCQKDGCIPFVEELALEIGVNDDTLVEWVGKHGEFSATVKRLKTLQKLHLKKGALERKLHPSIAMFLLKANHDVSEKAADFSLSKLYDESEPERDKSLVVTIVSSVPKNLEDAIAATEYARKNEEKFRNAAQTKQTNS